ncbi:Transcription initiation factor TFIID subunit 1 [Diplonema papillatum]|nr:Transcription initiation factor TFIID subunit 1 [Diplonema papillatum]
MKKQPTREPEAAPFEAQCRVVALCRGFAAHGRVRITASRLRLAIAPAEDGGRGAVNVSVRPADLRSTGAVDPRSLPPHTPAALLRTHAEDHVLIFDDAAAKAAFLFHLQAFRRSAFAERTEHRAASTEHRAASTEHRAASTEHRAASTEHRAASTEHRAASTEHRAASTEHRAASTEHRAASTEHRAASTEHRAASTEHRAASTEHRAASTEHRAASTEHRAASTEHRAASTEHRAASTEHRAASTPPVENTPAPAVAMAQFLDLRHAGLPPELRALICADSIAGSELEPGRRRGAAGCPDGANRQPLLLLSGDGSPGFSPPSPEGWAAVGDSRVGPPKRWGEHGESEQGLACSHDAAGVKRARVAPSPRGRRGRRAFDPPGVQAGGGQASLPASQEVLHTEPGPGLSHDEAGVATPRSSRIPASRLTERVTVHARGGQASPPVSQEAHSPEGPGLSHDDTEVANPRNSGALPGSPQAPGCALDESEGAASPQPGAGEPAAAKPQVRRRLSRGEKWWRDHEVEHVVKTDELAALWRRRGRSAEKNTAAGATDVDAGNEAVAAALGLRDGRGEQRAEDDARQTAVRLPGRTTLSLSTACVLLADNETRSRRAIEAKGHVAFLEVSRAATHSRAVACAREAERAAIAADFAAQLALARDKARQRSPYGAHPVVPTGAEPSRSVRLRPSEAWRQKCGIISSLVAADSTNQALCPASSHLELSLVRGGTVSQAHPSFCVSPSCLPALIGLELLFSLVLAESHRRSALLLESAAGSVALHRAFVELQRQTAAAAAPPSSPRRQPSEPRAARSSSSSVSASPPGRFVLSRAVATPPSRQPGESRAARGSPSSVSASPPGRFVLSRSPGAPPSSRPSLRRSSSHAREGSHASASASPAERGCSATTASTAAAARLTTRRDGRLPYPRGSPPPAAVRRSGANMSPHRRRQDCRAREGSPGDDDLNRSGSAQRPAVVPTDSLLQSLPRRLQEGEAKRSRSRPSQRPPVVPTDSLSQSPPWHAKELSASPTEITSQQDEEASPHRSGRRSAVDRLGAKLIRQFRSRRELTASSAGSSRHSAASASTGVSPETQHTRDARGVSEFSPPSFGGHDHRASAVASLSASTNRLSDSIRSDSALGSLCDIESIAWIPICSDSDSDEAPANPWAGETLSSSDGEAVPGAVPPANVARSSRKGNRAGSPGTFGARPQVGPTGGGSRPARESPFGSMASPRALSAARKPRSTAPRQEGDHTQHVGNRVTRGTEGRNGDENWGSRHTQAGGPWADGLRDAETVGRRAIALQRDCEVEVARAYCLLLPCGTADLHRAHTRRDAEFVQWLQRSEIVVEELRSRASFASAFPCTHRLVTGDPLSPSVDRALSYEESSSSGSLLFVDDDGDETSASTEAPATPQHGVPLLLEAPQRTTPRRSDTPGGREGSTPAPQIPASRNVARSSPSVESTSSSCTTPIMSGSHEGSIDTPQATTTTLRASRNAFAESPPPSALSKTAAPIVTGSRGWSIGTPQTTKRPLTSRNVFAESPPPSALSKTAAPIVTGGRERTPQTTNSPLTSRNDFAESSPPSALPKTAAPIVAGGRERSTGTPQTPSTPVVQPSPSAASTTSSFPTPVLQGSQGGSSGESRSAAGSEGTPHGPPQQDVARRSGGGYFEALSDTGVVCFDSADAALAPLHPAGGVELGGEGGCRVCATHPPPRPTRTPTWGRACTGTDAAPLQTANEMEYYELDCVGGGFMQTEARRRASRRAAAEEGGFAASAARWAGFDRSTAKTTPRWVAAAAAAAGEAFTQEGGLPRSEKTRRRQPPPQPSPPGEAFVGARRRFVDKSVDPIVPIVPMASSLRLQPQCPPGGGDVAALAGQRGGTPAELGCLAPASGWAGAVESECARAMAALLGSLREGERAKLGWQSGQWDRSLRGLGLQARQACELVGWGVALAVAEAGCAEASGELLSSELRKRELSLWDHRRDLSSKRCLCAHRVLMDGSDGMPPSDLFGVARLRRSSSPPSASVTAGDDSAVASHTYIPPPVPLLTVCPAAACISGAIEAMDEAREQEMAALSARAAEIEAKFAEEMRELETRQASTEQELLLRLDRAEEAARDAKSSVADAVSQLSSTEGDVLALRAVCSGRAAEVADETRAAAESRAERADLQQRLEASHGTRAFLQRQLAEVDRKVCGARAQKIKHALLSAGVLVHSEADITSLLQATESTLPATSGNRCGSAYSDRQGEVFREGRGECEDFRFDRLDGMAHEAGSFSPSLSNGQGGNPLLLHEERGAGARAVGGCDHIFTPAHGGGGLCLFDGGPGSAGTGPCGTNVWRGIDDFLAADGGSGGLQFPDEAVRAQAEALRGLLRWQEAQVRRHGHARAREHCFTSAARHKILQLLQAGRQRERDRLSGIAEELRGLWEGGSSEEIDVHARLAHVAKLGRPVQLGGGAAELWVVQGACLQSTEEAGRGCVAHEEEAARLRFAAAAGVRPPLTARCPNVCRQNDLLRELLSLEAAKSCHKTEFAVSLSRQIAALVTPAAELSRLMTAEAEERRRVSSECSASLALVASYYAFNIKHSVRS